MHQFTVAVLFVGIVSSFPALPARAAEQADLSKLTIPDNAKEATRTIREWLTARGIDSKENKSGESLIFRRTLLLNIYPMVYKGDLDRLRLAVFYTPKPEHKGSDALIKLTNKFNKAQNLLQVYIHDDGDMVISGNITFFDELTSREFDTYIDLMVSVIQRYILSDPDVKKYFQ